MIRRALVVAWAAVAIGCRAGDVVPAAFDPAQDACAFCRMVGSNGRSAGQIVSPGESPRFFDDIGCLRDYLRSGASVPAEAVAFVVDHDSRAWVRAGQALYTYAPTVATPMNSHLIAHASQASRDRDADAKGGEPRSMADTFVGVPVPGAAE